MRNQLLVFQLLMIIISDYIHETQQRRDENTCLNSQTYKEVIYVDSTVQKPVTETSWCWDVLKGFKCRRQRIINEKVKVPRVVNRTRFVLECCAGYVENDYNFKCVPYCSAGCGNGQCIKPNTCNCYSGYYGLYCDKSCPVGYWGRNCLEKCECLNEGECDGVNGRCLCKPGWLGSRCEIPCEMSSYGLNGDCRPLPPKFIPTDIEAHESLLEQEDFVEKSIVRPVEMQINFATLKWPETTTEETTQEEEEEEEEEESTMLSLSPKSSQVPQPTDSPFVLDENITSTFTPLDHSVEYTEVDSDSWREGTETSTTENSTENPNGSVENFEATQPWLEENTFTAETATIENNKSTLSTIRYGSPEVETIDGGSRNATEHPTTFPPTPSTVTTATTTTTGTTTTTATTATMAIETTFTGETTSSKNSNFKPTKIDGYNFTEDENDTNNNDKSDADDDNNNNNYDHGKNESNEERTSEISGSGTRGEAPEVSEEGIEIFRHLHTFRFIPSLSVLTGVTILIIIIGVRWLALQHRRKNKKLLAKKKDEFFRSKQREKYRDSLIIGKGFPETSVYLYEINLTEERPILQTFKPPPDS